MASVRFNLRPNQSRDPQIQLIYRLDGDKKKVVIGTGLHVPEKYWNKRDMRVRETTKFMDFNFYNALLADWDNAVNEVKKRYLLKGLSPAKNQFKDEVIEEMKGSRKHKEIPLFTKYFEDYIGMKSRARLSRNTLKEYRGALNKVNAYRKAKLNGRNLEFDDLHERFFADFIGYLSETLQQNTINKLIKRIRSVLNHATTKGYNHRMDYKSDDCQVSYINQPKIYLNEEEIQAIRELHLEDFSRLDKVRDRFLIGLGTGLRYSDFIRVSLDHVTTDGKGRGIIEILTKKNKRFVIIPLKGEVKKILEKYSGYPPSISESKFNKYVKELCMKAGVDTIISRNVSGEQVTYQKWELVSSHICRRSFATNGFKAGLHPKQLMPITGHTTVKVFTNYICIDDAENVETLGEHPYFS